MLAKEALPITSRAPRIRCAGRLAASVSMLALCAGCGDGLPKTIPVSGSVRYQGEPLTDGTVVFHPHEIPEGLPRRTAHGRLQPDGTFTLTTFRAGDGAVPGTYRVTIHSYLSEPASSDDDQNPGEYVWRIPQRYGDPSRSGLTADVSPEAQQPLEFAFVVEQEGSQPFSN